MLFYIHSAVGNEPSIICEEVNLCETVSLPCGNGGTCVPKLKTFECLCPPGLGGKGCKLSTSSCDDQNPCQHGGTCSVLSENGGVTCGCPVGYTGQFCEEDINECENGDNPCRNGGNCQNFVSIRNRKENILNIWFANRMVENKLAN